MNINIESRNAGHNPLLADHELPDFPAILPDHVNPAIDRLLADYRAEVARLIADPEARDFERLMAPLERMAERLARAWAPIGHLHGVKDSPELRSAYNQAEQKLAEHDTELGQNRALFEAVRVLHAHPEFAGLDRARRTLVEDALREFRLSGVGLDEPERSRFKTIQTELSALRTGFAEAVLDGPDRSPNMSLSACRSPPATSWHRPPVMPAAKVTWPP